MNRIVIAVLLIGGGVSAQTDTPVTKPDEVCASLVTEISAISSNHVELAEFPAYAKNRESGSRISTVPKILQQFPLNQEVFRFRPQCRV